MSAAIEPVINKYYILKVLKVKKKANYTRMTLERGK